MLPLWLGLYLAGLVAMVRSFPAALARTDPTEVLTVAVFLPLFLGLWLTFGALGCYRLLFVAAGRELVIIDAAHLTFRREMPLFTRVRTYPLAEVRNLHATLSLMPGWLSIWASNSRYAWDLLGLTGGVIAFDYGGRTVRIGGGMDEEEAHYLVAYLHRRFPTLGAAGT
jgi:hypothetical protein